MASEHILDMDTSKSITDLGISLNTKYIQSTIYTLIDLTIKFGKKIGIVYQSIGEVKQYYLPIKYLGHILPIIFEHDDSYQYITIVYYNHNQTKTFLKIALCINDEPTIKYIENDHSGSIPSFENVQIKLKPGEYLMHFSHCFLSFIGFQRIRLDDDSHLIILDDEKHELVAKLWLYYIIKYGKSWYAKFGYEPGNCSVTEFNLLVEDVRMINLWQVKKDLIEISEGTFQMKIDPHYISTSETITNLISLESGSLYEYTLNHPLHQFIKLTNAMSQSIFMKEITDGSHSLTFSWAILLDKLRIGNVLQINNDISKHYYKLP